MHIDCIGLFIYNVKLNTWKTNGKSTCRISCLVNFY